jgi:hypothetical protein
VSYPVLVNTLSTESLQYPPRAAFSKGWLIPCRLESIDFSHPSKRRVSLGLQLSINHLNLGGFDGLPSLQGGGFGSLLSRPVEAFRSYEVITGFAPAPSKMTVWLLCLLSYITRVHGSALYRLVYGLLSHKMQHRS